MLNILKGSVDLLSMNVYLSLKKVLLYSFVLFLLFYLLCFLVVSCWMAKFSVNLRLKHLRNICNAQVTMENLRDKE